MDQKPNIQQSSQDIIALHQERGGILGIKAGMTQVYDEKGYIWAVSVIDLKPCMITQIKTFKNEGYSSVQVGFLDKKKKLTNRCEKGHLRALGREEGFYHYHEFRFKDETELTHLKVGQILSPEFIRSGDLIDVTARSKGKGFQGGMKRFHMAGGYKTHGASLSHRQLGSIGNRADPGKCFKNKKMPGHMGHERVTIQNVRVFKVDVENQLVLIQGSIPGPKSGIVVIRKAIKCGV